MYVNDRSNQDPAARAKILSAQKWSNCVCCRFTMTRPWPFPARQRCATLEAIRSAFMPQRVDPRARHLRRELQRSRPSLGSWTSTTSAAQLQSAVAWACAHNALEPQSACAYRRR